MQIIPQIADYFLSVTKEIEKAYKFASLADYSLKERIMIRLADRIFYLLIRTIGRTIRYEVEGLENFEAIGNAGKVPIYSFWHDRIFAGTYFFRDRRIAVITSQSMDGEYIARFIKRLGYGAIRGSSTRGGVGALVEMIRSMRKGVPMAFTVDGPKGPRYRAKAGPILLAKKTGNPLMPFLVECKNYWTINSWDKLQIPKPFTRARVIIAQPIYVATGAADKDIKIKLAKLQSTLDGLVVRGKQWRISE